MIVVLSLNTAIDRTLVVPRFHVGSIFRARESAVTAGGKGLNVARTIRSLGSPVSVIGFLGGAATTLVERSCAELGIEQRWVRTREPSRTCVIVLDPESPRQTVVNEDGPRVCETEIDRLRQIVLESVQRNDLVCISGSAPPGVPVDFYAEIVSAARGRGARVLVDASGRMCAEALAAHPWAAAPNVDEAREALGDEGSPESVARQLAALTQHALVTLGADGLLHANGTTLSRYLPPAVPMGNAVASGDAFAAGFLVGIERGWEPDRAIRLAVACGASNAARPFPGIGDVDEIERLMSEVTVDRLL